MEFTNRQKIVRKYTGHHNDYKLYRDNLANDFYHRCAYCDTLDNIITTPFEIDHFIPRNTFKDIKNNLECDYDNLIYSCKKCNRSKGSKFSGDITAENPTNELFYDPVETNYNDIFYRNKYGIIMSDDPKGKNMIAEMRLYRPIYALAWIIGQANSVIDTLDKRIAITKNSDEFNALQTVKIKLTNYVYKINRIFIANYNSNNDFNNLEEYT